MPKEKQTPGSVRPTPANYNKQIADEVSGSFREDEQRKQRDEKARKREEKK